MTKFPDRHNVFAVASKTTAACIFGVVLACLCSCSNTKYLRENQQLYTGSELELKSDTTLERKGALKSELNDLIRPEPNNSFLGIRPSLWIYNIMGEPKKEKGIRSWIKTKVGEPPVLLEDVSPKRTASLLHNYLHNHGYFHAEVKHELKAYNGDKKIKVKYTANVARPYRINRIIFPKGDEKLENIIHSLKETSLLQPGETYSIEKLKEERERIDNALKERGYYYFNADFLLFKADSTIGRRTVNIHLQLKRDIPEKARKVYKINDIYIRTQYTLEQDPAGLDTIKYFGYHILTKEMLFKPEVIANAVRLAPGKLYNPKTHSLTISRLMGLGAFKFANITYDDIDSTDNGGYLNAHILITPRMKKSLRLELETVSKSNNFAGPGLEASFRNRNAFGGAELLMLNITTGVETQVTGRLSGPFSYEIGIGTELHVPRFMVPFRVRDVSSRFLPFTQFQLGYSLLSRVQFFRMYSTDASYGFRWRETFTKEHQLNPVAITFTQLGRQTPQFQRILDRNPLLKRSFEEQFILGTEYTYTYNSQLEERKEIPRQDFFFRGGIDLSGNTMHLLQTVARDEPPTADRPYTLFGQAYSQYSRFDVDVRYYFRPKRNDKIATRLIAGVGIPYGNSHTMPYIKQYFIGGTNSIRAFQARSVGPGTYEPTDPDGTVFFFEQTGDIRLEGNIEYRFPLIGIFNGAVFTDAGNIWLVNENPDLPGGAFKFNAFYRQLALGTGSGLRMDVEFFVIRIDLGMALRKPWKPEGERWIIDEFNPGSPSWRRENLVLNIAIGYPF